MNRQDKTETVQPFDPLDYEELHRNLKTIATLISGIGWRRSIGCSDDPDALALFKLAQMLEEEARKAEKFFHAVRIHYKGGEA